MLRGALYEAANVALPQVKRPFALQHWGQKTAEAKGAKRARTAVARKLAGLLHSLWLNETEFRCLNLATLIPISHAQDDFVRNVGDQTSFGT